MERVWVPINFGHGILEDLIPAFTMLQTLNMKADRPLFMTDERNLKQVGTFVHHQSALNKYGLETIEKWSAEWMAMLTLGKPLALCGGNSIQDHPCPAQKNTKDGDSQQQDSETIQACFSSLSFGYHSKMLYDGLTDREPYLYQFRDSIIENWNLKDLQYTPKYKRDQDIFLIGVQKKPKGSYNLDIIDNCEELAQYLTEHVSQIKERVGKEVQVMVVELEKMSMIEQILFFIYEIDMYITTQGAASYYSFFMKPGGYLIYAPSCSTETNSCTDDHISFQRPLAHLVITSMVRFDVEMLECLNRKPETNPKITHDPKLVVIGGCILKVNKEKLLQMVLTSL
ncbi:hypothetical protein C9374_011851 [Naegleria lovaniensis]|uniref:Glycosyltransferase 61 catalytic domain-containing protein n=1 Tax=Naegleria lovaniensis TaxID=51637 RepID=A0AA88KIC3_NAELO|nr:uncharacterized protein C9374_011851 [Naegleria lovaniensis]KAG2373762.1 hypothetical protein C9374_011851 [Naegleria lovaniensis]